MIDFHVHLDLYPNPLKVAKDCIEKKMYVLSVTTTPSAWTGSSALAPKDSRIRTALGLHPQIAHERKSELYLFDKYLPETDYVGEIGLDGGPEFKQHWDDQIFVFDHILDACTSIGGRVMTIHSRRASKAVLDRLAAFPRAGLPILHWFSGTRKDLDRALDIGCWFSVGPAMLRSQKSLDLLGYIPSDRILTETDGPFAQIDGRTAMPWDSQMAISGLAKIWNIEEKEANNVLLNNLRVLVGSSLQSKG